MGPLVIGLAAGALGWVLGTIGQLGKKEKPENKKEEPAPQPPPDPRIDQIMQSQARQELMLNQLLQNQQSLMGGGCCGVGQGLGQGGFAPQINFNQVNFTNNYNLLQNPAAMGAFFSGSKGDPAAFCGQLESLLQALPPPRVFC